MMSLLQLAVILVTLFILEQLYFKIANRFNIIDKPNERSSHNAPTLRGGGIIFSLSTILWFVLYGFQFPYFLVSLTAIAVISFLDDVLTLNNKIRLVVHMSAVVFLFIQWGLFLLPWYWLIVALIFVVATINAYNFMDGINGITGLYSLLAISTLYYINERIVRFTNADLLIIVGLSVVVFNYFNFRTKAKCFAGDVGSVSIAIILVFFIGQLILATQNLAYLLLLLVYGLDTATTLFFRGIRKENIFQAHRTHFYQYLANQLKWNHLVIASIYFVVQLVCNLVLIFLLKNNFVLSLLFTGLVLIAFLTTRFLVEGKTYLLKGVRLNGKS